MKIIHTILPVVFLLFFQINNAQKLVTGKNVAVTNTESGKVRGYIHDGTYIYKGIPYAQANRFEAAQKTTPWEDVRSSTTYGPVAPLMTPTTEVTDDGK